MHRDLRSRGLSVGGFARLRSALLAAVLVSAVACGSKSSDSADETPLGGEDAAPPPAPPEDAAVPPPPAGPVATDSQVVEAMVVANQAVIDVAKLAQTKGPHSDVLEYADRMVLEHGLANERLDALVKALALQPAESDLSQQLRAQADQDLLELQSAAGFDLAYLDAQIAFHTATLEALDTTLIPKSKDQRVRLELMNQRDEVENHLDVARAIVAQLTGVLPDGGPLPPPPPTDAGTSDPPDAGLVTP